MSKPKKDSTLFHSKLNDRLCLNCGFPNRESDRHCMYCKNPLLEEDGLVSWVRKTYYILRWRWQLKQRRDRMDSLSGAHLPILRLLGYFIIGLAMSSRNGYLSEEDRSSARSLSQALESAQALVIQGECSAKNIRTEIRKIIEQKQGTEVDYISVCDPESFAEQTKIHSKVLVALAVRVGNTRLIDNRIIGKA